MIDTDETVMAYVDGELDAAARAEFERALATDPELARRVARQQALRKKLRGALDATLDEPVPTRLTEAVRAASTGSVADERTETPRPRRPQLAWFAMAASVVVGMLIGQRVVLWPGDRPQIAADRGGPIASGELAQVLSNRLASEQGPTDRVRVGVSFRAVSGDFCRTFLMHADVSVAGLACRTGDEWRIPSLQTVVVADGEPGGLRQATSELPESVREAVEARIQGVPLDAKGELQARAQGWREGH